MGHGQMDTPSKEFSTTSLGGAPGLPRVQLPEAQTDRDSDQHQRQEVEAPVARMERAGAILSSAEMAAYELLGRSDSDAFKAMLPHFKG